MKDVATLRQRQKQTNETLKKQAVGLGKVTKRYLEQLKHTDRVAFHDLANRKFIELVRSLIEANELKGIYIWEVYREAAYRIGISPETAKRYLLEHSATTAEFHTFGKFVILNGNYRPQEDEEEDEDQG